MKSSKQEIIDYYDKCEIHYRLIWELQKVQAMHYGIWDNEVANLTEALMRENEVLAEIADIKAEDVVVDAGCGTGGSAVYLAQDIGCRVIGVNLPEKQLREARKFAHQRQLENFVSFIQADYTDTGLEENSVDVVWALESVCYAEDKDEFVKEASRLLKKEGRLVIADGFLDKENVTESDRKMMEDWLDGWKLNPLVSVSKFRSFLKKRGFKNVSFKNITDNVMRSARRLYLFSFPATLAQSVAQLLGISGEIEKGNVVAARNQYKLLQKGVWSYYIVYAEKK